MIGRPAWAEMVGSDPLNGGAVDYAGECEQRMK